MASGKEASVSNVLSMMPSPQEPISNLNVPGASLPTYQ
jgi:hypothetical protein